MRRRRHLAHAELNTRGTRRCPCPRRVCAGMRRAVRRRRSPLARVLEREAHAVQRHAGNDRRERNALHDHELDRTRSQLRHLREFAPELIVRKNLDVDRTVGLALHSVPHLCRAHVHREVGRRGAGHLVFELRRLGRARTIAIDANADAVPVTKRERETRSAMDGPLGRKESYF